MTSKKKSDFVAEFEQKNNPTNPELKLSLGENVDVVEIIDENQEIEQNDENQQAAKTVVHTSGKNKAVNKIIILIYEKLGFFQDDYEKQEFADEISTDFSETNYKPNKIDKLFDSFLGSRIGMMLLPILTRYIIYFCMKLDFISGEEKQKAEIKEKLFEEIKNGI